MFKNSDDLVSAVQGTGGPRIVLYSHDTIGLGHLRRQMLVASSLSTLSPRPSILMICGAKEVGAFSFPPGLDCVTLPAIEKTPLGLYRSRRLGVNLNDLVRIRRETIRAAVKGFDPDIVIADKVPGGFSGELIPALSWLRSRGKATCVLGLREILDEPSKAIREWESERSDEIIDRFYAGVWVYGDQVVCDTAREYDFAPTTVGKVTYTGYLNALAGARTAPRDAAFVPEPPAGTKVVLCVVGGGDDGEAIARAFASCPIPDGHRGVLVTGPFMSQAASDDIKRTAAANGRVDVHGFVTEPERFLSRADRVISMGGYNTVCEVLASGKPLLAVPRVTPRQEQRIRVERMHALGLLDYLLPNRLGPDALASWVASASRPRRDAREVLRFDGLRRIGQLAGEMLGSPERRREVERAAG